MFQVLWCYHLWGQVTDNTIMFLGRFATWPNAEKGGQALITGMILAETFVAEAELSCNFPSFLQRQFEKGLTSMHTAPLLTEWTLR